MKVILTQDINKLGKKGQIKEVSAGYGSNFLIPRNLALLASDQNLKDLEEQEQMIAKQAEEELIAAQDLAGKLDGLEFEMPVKTAKDGKLFGSISANFIAEFLAAQGHNLKKEQIKLAEPIKETGEYEIALNLPHGLEATIKLIIVEE